MMDVTVKIRATAWNGRHANEHKRTEELGDIARVVEEALRRRGRLVSDAAIADGGVTIEVELP